MEDMYTKKGMCDMADNGDMSDKEDQAERTSDP